MRSSNPEVRERALSNMRAYYYRTRAPWVCECGRVIEGGQKNKHLKSQIHSQLMNPLTIVAGPTQEEFTSFFNSK